MPDGAPYCATNAGAVNTCDQDPNGIGYVIRCPTGWDCEYLAAAKEYGCCTGPLCNFGAPETHCP